MLVGQKYPPGFRKFFITWKKGFDAYQKSLLNPSVEEIREEFKSFFLQKAWSGDWKGNSEKISSDEIFEWFIPFLRSDDTEVSRDELIPELEDKRILMFKEGLSEDMWYLSRKEIAESLTDKFIILKRYATKDSKTPG